MKTLFTSFNYFDGISLTRQDAENCSHSGSCDNDVEITVNKPYAQKQLNVISNESLVKELKEYGAWDDEELQDNEQNKRRIIWIAAGNIQDNQN